MKRFTFFTLFFVLITHVNLALAGITHYDITLTFIDDTTFRGSFDYDPVNQKVTNLQGILDDVLMGNFESLTYQLVSQSDGRGGITVIAYALNTTAIATNPPINNNVYVAINFHATNPTLGSTNPAQLAYMDCSPLALMGKTCMYYLSGHNPVVPMEGGHGVLAEKITTTAQVSRSDCLFNWAESNYPQLFSPAGASTQSSSPYHYRFYQYTNSYIGVSSLDDHVYYLGPDGNFLDVGSLSTWLTTAGC
jgi:hypothetical protein